MGYSFEQHGLDDQGNRLREIIHGVENPDPLLNTLGFALQEEWKSNIDDGQNERWEAGPSKRVLKHGGITLRDRGFMKQSIVGVQTGPDEVTVGSALTVGSGWNLLGIHEFGAMIHRTVKPGAVKLRTDARGELLHREGTNLAIFASPLHKRYRSVAFEGGKEYTIRIPRRPTSPFDWDRGELTPHAAKLATDMVGNYMVGLAT